MTYPQKQSGASLLTILLLVAVVGVMVLAGSKALQESSRAAAVLSTHEEARQIAESGVMEGLLYLNTSPGSLTDGEYGTITDRGTTSANFSLTPLRRGYTTEGGCSTQTAAESVSAQTSSIDKSCPYYDIAIRDRAAYGPGQTDISKFALSSRDFPGGTAVTIPIRATSVMLHVVADPSIANASFTLCTTKGTCNGLTTQSIISGGAYPVSDAPLTYHYVKITVTYNTVPSTPMTIITANSNTDQVVIGKGYTTLDVTGHSGDTQVRLLYAVRVGQPYLSEMTGVFDQYGILK